MRWHRFRIPAWFILGLLLVCLLHSPEVVLARAGDGGSYGGGSSSGSGGGGGGGDIGAIFYLIRLVFEYPKIGVPLVLIVVAIMYFGGNSAHSGYVGHTIRKGYAFQDAASQEQAENERQQALTALRSRDPQFDEARFLERVTTAFYGIQEAWSRQNLAPVRAFISDGIRERFSLQFQIQQAKQIRNQMDDVSVLKSHIAAVASDANFDTMHVMILASATDYNMDLTGQTLDGDSDSEPWVEYWSFHRRPGATTLAQPGAMEGHCPHCGVVLDIVDRATCPSCSSTVNSGDYDWVLAEITQAQEWRVPETSTQIPGLAELCSQDPGFSVQHIEDRVSVMFWRMKAAEFFGDPHHALPVLAEKMAELLKQQLAPTAVSPTAPPRKFWNTPAVGKVELIDGEPGTPGEMDRLRVNVRWSGTLCAGDPRGSYNELRGKAIYNSVFVIVRSHGVQSLPGKTFSSASCPNCGAAIAVTAEASCQYCGTSLVDGRFDWVLEAIEPYTADMALRRKAQNQIEGSGSIPALPATRIAARDSELSLAVLVHVMRADGTVDEKERQALSEIGARRGLSKDQIEAIVNTSFLEDADLPLPRDSEQAMRYLEQLVQASLADGNVSSQEKRLMYAYAGRMNIAPADVNHMIARCRRQEYQAARRVLKRGRSRDTGRK